MSERDVLEIGLEAYQRQARQQEDHKAMHVNLTVKAAPTEESVRLYGEMLEKARGEILEHLAVENELINFHAVKLATTGLMEKIVVTFKLNGKLYVEEVSFGYTEVVLHAIKAELIRFVATRMAQAITGKLLENVQSL